MVRKLVPTGRKKQPPLVPDTDAALHSEIRKLILEAREQTAQAVNAALTATYWKVGDRIRRETLQEKRAEYGERIVISLSRRLKKEFGRGFDEKSLRHMIRFAEVFPDYDIVSSLLRQLSWTHFLSIIYLKDSYQREFYAETCRLERWSTRTLQGRIASQLYERTALSRKPEKLIAEELKALREEDKVTPDLVFRDPYILDFLHLKDTYSETDLESAIIREMESFLMELGDGFAFVARQKRFTLDDVDYYMDLLFYHRKLRRLVVFELKLEEFKPGDAGQVELYLRWLDRHERQEGEERPIGIILCAGKKRQTVEYMGLERSGIHVAEYCTELPPREVLEARFREAITRAREQLSNGENRR